METSSGDTSTFSLSTGNLYQAGGTGISVSIFPSIALSDEGKIETEITKCIKCCACVKECPNGARVFDTPYTPMLHQKCAARREPELFI